MLGRMVEIKDMLGNHQIIRADGRKVDELRPVRIPPLHRRPRRLRAHRMR